MSTPTGKRPDAQAVDQNVPPPEKREWRVFLVTTFLLIPGATVAFVGAFGFAIWAYQMVAGPPGPPG